MKNKSKKKTRPGTGRKVRKGEVKVKVGRAGRRRWLIIPQDVRGFSHSQGRVPERLTVDGGIYRIREVPHPTGAGMKVFRLVGPGRIFINPVYLEKKNLDFEVTAQDPLAKVA